MDKWDVFISHAAEDKKAVAKPLADALASFGLRVWYDEFTLKPGDSLSRSIDMGLASSNYGIVILSTAFFAKRWPEYELRGLTAKEIATGKVIIPIWHNVDREEVLRFSPPLADKLAIKSSGLSATQLAVAIIEVTNPELFEKIHLRMKFLSATEKATIETIDPKKVIFGPARHKELPPDLVSRIRLIRAALLGIYTHSMEFWIDGFKRDSHPSREIYVWERICAVLWEYMSMTKLTSSQVPHVFNVVFGLSSGTSESQFSEDLAQLPRDAFTILTALMSHDIPVYDVKDSATFEELETPYEEVIGDRELFPVDLPNELLKDLNKEQDKDKK